MFFCSSTGYCSWVVVFVPIPTNLMFMQLEHYWYFGNFLYGIQFTEIIVLNLSIQFIDVHAYQLNSLPTTIFHAQFNILIAYYQCFSCCIMKISYYIFCHKRLLCMILQVVYDQSYFNSSHLYILLLFQYSSILACSCSLFHYSVHYYYETTDKGKANANEQCYCISQFYPPLEDSSHEFVSGINRSHIGVMILMLCAYVNRIQLSLVWES